MSEVAEGQLLRTRRICHQHLGGWAQRKTVEEIITPSFPNLVHSVKPKHEKQEENNTRARHIPNPENR